ncbi:MAG TPA: PD-(D/E)XK nuclease family protein [Acidimicrobiales bacterium]|nr:PD-(D/E)XK nuclease family protein [Acidimicrobiales bacterium]
MDVVSTPYGRPALDALARAVRAAKADEPLAPVTVVVPGNHVGVTARRALASGIAGPLTSRGLGTIGVGYLTPYRLAELLGAPGLAATGRRPVSNPVVAAALRRALHHQPGLFGPVAEHPATEEALVAAYAEIADLSAAGRDRLGATSPRAADVVRLCTEARAHLAPRWYDEADLVRSARRALQGPPTPAAQLGHVIVHLPQELSRQGAALLRAAADVHPTTVVVGLTGDERADAGVLRSVGRLGGTPPPITAIGPAGGRRWPVDKATTRVVTTSDADDEVRTALRAVLDAARDGVPLERMAVLYPAEQPYARLVHEHTRAAGIPVNGAAAEGLAGRVLGRTLLDLLSLRDRGYRRRDLLGLLAAAPVHLRPGPDGRRPSTAQWERLAREAAVVAGRAQWDVRLAQHADEIEQQIDELLAAEVEPDDEIRASRVATRRRRVERARGLRRFVLELIDELDQAARVTQSWRERVAWLRRLAQRLLGGDTARATWPDDERRAAERVEAALDRLVALDDIDGPADLEVFRRTLQLELDADLGRVGRFGEGVLVAPLSFAVGLDLDLVVVLGMAEGTLPSRVADDSLLPDRERLATGGELPLRRERVGRQHRQLHAALAAAERHVLCAPRGDLRASNERVLSRWLVDLVKDLDDGVRDDSPSFAYAIGHLDFPATEQEYRLRAPGWTRTHDPLVVAGLELQSARRSSRFTRYDGNLAGLAVRSPHDDVVSATRLESWATCPFAYFMRQVLRVEPIEDPAELLWISALEKGSLVHAVLERFLLAVLARPPEQQPAPDDPWTADDHALLARIGTEVCAEFEGRGVVGRPLFWRRDQARILMRLDRFLAEDSARRAATRSRPIAAELAFGLPDGGLPPVDVPIANGRTLTFRGSADRVDVGDDGTLRIIDYKTGRPDDYRFLSEDNPDDHGTHLQLVVYGVAARASQGTPTTPVVSEYWFVNDRPPLLHKGYAVTDAVLAQVGTTLATIVDGIEGGVFPARPTATSSDPYIRCRYCDPDGLGVTDRRREWERKRDDPAVAPYARLAEAPTEAETRAKAATA